MIVPMFMLEAIGFTAYHFGRKAVIGLITMLIVSALMCAIGPMKVASNAHWLSRADISTPSAARRASPARILSCRQMAPLFPRCHIAEIMRRYLIYERVCR